jgi:hypothetical protein
VKGNLITGSDPEWNTPEGQATREGEAPPAYSVRTPWGWQSYKNLEPFSRGLAALVDHQRGKGTWHIVKSQSEGFLLNQLNDLVQITKEPAGQKMNRVLATTVAGVAVPNLFRSTIKQIRQAREGGAYRPIEDTMRRTGEGFATNLGRNIASEATGGMAFQNPIRVDYWGRDVTHAPESITSLGPQLIGLPSEKDKRTAWDIGFAKWNERADEAGKHDLVWNPYKTVDSFKDHGIKEPLTLEQLGELQKTAGPERLRRFNNTGFDPETLTAQQVKVLRRMDGEVDAWAVRRMRPDWRQDREAKTAAKADSGAAK